MDYQKYVNQLDSETVDKLRTAVELGKWENGDKLSETQIDSAMQAIMLWQAKHQVVGSNEPFKVDSNGEFTVGKGSKLNETPLEFRSSIKLETKKDIIFTSKGN